jgi:glycerate 2-kinase
LDEFCIISHHLYLIAVYFVRTMHILIAPNAFKNSLSATAAAEAIRNGLQQSKLDCTTVLFPVGDGGDGTAPLLSTYLQGTPISCTVHDPLGRKIESSFSLADSGRRAIIELASASGLRLLSSNEYAPLHATTFGTGELMVQALDKEVREIILCIGGSATVDAGAGILRALGIRFLDSTGNELDGSPASFHSISSVDISQRDERIEYTPITILCDVQNPLLGDNGAAAVFGPQKGVRPEQIALLDKYLTRFSDLALGYTNRDISQIRYGGAAGGVSAGLYAYANANLVNGINHFLDLAHFDAQLDKADIVITGEGSLDEQTLQGKGPFGVAKRAKDRGIPVIGMAGRISNTPAMRQYFDTLLSINDDDVPMDMALKNTHVNLERTAKNLGDRLPY